MLRRGDDALDVHRLSPLERHASSYIGVSASKFDQMVGDGRMPSPKKIDACRVWDIHQLDAAFDALPGGGDGDDEWGNPVP
jgi:hypothetical protein